MIRIKTLKLTFHKLTWLEWIAIGLSVWFLLYPKPYKELFTVLLAIPLLGILLNGWQKPGIATLVKITKDENGEDEYDVADFIDVPAWLIGIRVMIDYHAETYYSLIIPFLVSIVMIVIILLATHKLIIKSTKSKFWIYGSILLNVSVYSCAATYGINCIYDNSDPVLYPVEVIDKEIHKRRSRRGTSTSYYLTITPYGHKKDPEDLRVSHGFFDEVSIGEEIFIHRQEGLFGIPWIYPVHHEMQTDTN